MASDTVPMAIDSENATDHQDVEAKLKLECIIKLYPFFTSKFTPFILECLQNIIQSWLSSQDPTRELTIKIENIFKSTHEFRTRDIIERPLIDIVQIAIEARIMEQKGQFETEMVGQYLEYLDDRIHTIISAVFGHESMVTKSW